MLTSHLVRFCGIHLRAITLRVAKILFCIMILKIMIYKLLSHLPVCQWVNSNNEVSFLLSPIEIWHSNLYFFHPNYPAHNELISLSVNYFLSAVCNSLLGKNPSKCPACFATITNSIESTLHTALLGCMVHEVDIPWKLSPHYWSFVQKGSFSTRFSTHSVGNANFMISFLLFSEAIRWMNYWLQVKLDFRYGHFKLLTYHDSIWYDILYGMVMTKAEHW